MGAPPDKKFVLSSDVSFDNPDEDQLGYAPFAEHLALSFVRMAPPEGLVVAIYAPWGAGKSTLLGFIETKLTHLPDEDKPHAPVIVHFNPWWFSGHEDLARIFFRQLQAALKDSEWAEQFKGAYDALTAYSDAISDATAAVIEAVTHSETIGKAASGLVGNRLDAAKNQSIPDLKRRLEKKLDEVGKRIVVVMDDIDRLTTEEIRQLFRVVKAIANFPNILYLLAFDKTVVVRALSEPGGIDGEEYLEKIVQVPIDLPLPEHDGIRKLFLTRIQQVLALGTTTLPTVDLEEVYRRVGSFLRTPRDVVRLTNAVAVTYPAVAGEVRENDLIGIEALRLFYPPIYEVIRRNAKSFAGFDFWDISFSGSPRDREPYYDQLVGMADERDRFAVKSLLKYLFPKLTAVWGNTAYTYRSEQEWAKQLRVCSRAYFDLYFRLTVPTEMIRHDERTRILMVANTDPEALLTEFVAITKAGPNLKIMRYLSVLGMYANRITNTTSLIETLLRRGDELLNTYPIGTWAVDLGTEISYLIFLLLGDDVDEKDRKFQLLEKAVSASASLGTLVELLIRLRLQHGRYRNQALHPYETTVTAEHLDRLEAILLNKIQEKSPGRTLLQVRNLEDLLNTWAWIGSPNAQSPDYRAPKAWVQSITKNDDASLVVFLERMIDAPRGQITVDLANCQFHWDSLPQLLNVAEAYDRLESLRGDLPLTDLQRTAVQTFQEQYERAKIQAAQTHDGTNMV